MLVFGGGGIGIGEEGTLEGRERWKERWRVGGGGRNVERWGEVEGR